MIQGSFCSKLNALSYDVLYICVCEETSGSNTVLPGFLLVLAAVVAVAVAVIISAVS